MKVIHRERGPGGTVGQLWGNLLDKTNRSGCVSTVKAKNSPTGLKMSFIEQARRRQLIEALIEGVAEEGYAGASLAKVAERAAISKSVVVYHFGTKDELVEAAVEQIFGEMRAFIEPRLDAEQTARGQLRAYIGSEFAFLEHNRAKLLAVSYILMNHRDQRGVLYLQERSESAYLKSVIAILKKGQADGEFRSFALVPMATTLMHAINGGLAQWVANPKLSLAEYADELITIFDLATRKSSARATGKAAE